MSKKTDTKKTKEKKPEKVVKEKKTDITKAPNKYHLVITPDAPESAKWYVLHTQSNREQITSRTLKTRVQALGLENYIFETFIPTQEKIRVTKGKKYTIKERIFPGYLLVRMIIVDRSWLAVRTTQGITGFVGIGNNPTPLPPEEVDAVMAFSKQSAPKFQASFSLNEAVRIVEGPFVDLLGTVNVIDDSRGKVEVLVSIFGRETPVELDFVQVAKI